MKKIDRDELFGQVSQFLKTKGIDLHDGAYTQTIQKGCQVLADTINLSQQALARTRSEIGKKLDQARQAIHEKTAPKKSSARSKPASGPEPGPKKKEKPSNKRPRATRPETKSKPRTK